MCYYSLIPCVLYDLVVSCNAAQHDRACSIYPPADFLQALPLWFYILMDFPDLLVILNIEI